MHRNAPLTPEGRLRLCHLIEEGWTVASAAESMRISRQTAHKWWRRYQEAGGAGLEDRSSRPRRCPTKTPPKVERRVVELRRRHQLGPARLARSGRGPGLDAAPDLAAQRGLEALGPRSAHRSGHPPDRDLTSRRARPRRRQEAGQDPQGRRLAGQRCRPRTRQNGRAGGLVMGYAYVHSAIDAYSRLAYSEVHGNEQASHGDRLLASSPGLLRVLRHHRRTSDDRQRQVLHRPKSSTRSWSTAAIAHTRTKPNCPRTNGKVERYNRTLAQRVGLRPALSIRGSSNPSPGQVAPHVQPSPAPHGRRGPTRQPRQQRGWAEHLTVELGHPLKGKQSPFPGDSNPNMRCP